MAFRLRKDARRWFRHVEGSLPLEFDAFYFCLLAGLAAGRKADVPTNETTELVDYFPGEYKSRGRLIVALLLSRELRALGIELAERALLHQEIQKLIDPLSMSHLSELGMKEANRYAYGGYEVLTEWFDDPPQHIDTFLLLFARRIGDAETARTG
jgi:hypothetical protein